MKIKKDEPIINKVAKSGLVNFDLSDLRPKGKRIGIDLKDFLFQGLILKEKDFRQKIKDLDTSQYQDSFVYIYNSAEAIVPLWSYFLLTAKISETAQKVAYGELRDLETILMQDALANYDFSELKGKRVLVKGCSENKIPENAFVDLVQKLKPIVKSLMFGEACSNVPILKN